MIDALVLLAFCAATAKMTMTTTTQAFVPVAVSVGRPRQHQQKLFAASDDSNLPEFELPEDKERREAERLQQQAEKLRQQIRRAEQELNASRRERQPPAEVKEPTAVAVQDTGMSLRHKRILVAGANGRLGSMVCRYLLRQYGSIVQEVVAAVHVVGENSPTARGYGRLAYEVGAEDGVGRIGPAWSEDRVQTFQYSGEIMGDYHLNKLRIVECELLDPVQCASIAEDADCVIWCATDFNGNAPRAVSGLNIAFLFRAVADPTKGRVEIEGLQNMLGALKTAKQNRQRTSQLSGGAAAKQEDDNPNEPINFVLVSVAPDTLGNFETPFGEFNAIKREAEQNLQAFPSLSSTVLQMGKYEDNFVEEGQPLIFEKANAASQDKSENNGKRKCINRRDAARAAVEALLDEELKGEVVQVYTAKR